MREGNLNSVDVLIHSHHRNLVTLEQAALGGFGVKNIDSVKTLKSFKEEIKHVYRDIIILNHEPGYDIEKILRLIRSSEDSMNPFAIVILMSSTPSASVIKEALRNGVDGVMAIPFTATDLWRQLVHAVNRNRTFVRTGGYFGPCRRRLKNIPYMGEERRDEPVAKVS